MQFVFIQTGPGLLGHLLHLTLPLPGKHTFLFLQKSVTKTSSAAYLARPTIPDEEREKVPQSL